MAGNQAIKSSTYAVLIGVYFLLIGPVILFRPEEVLKLTRAFADPRILLLVGIPFVMISVLVLVHPTSDRGVAELVVRILAVLTILKLAVFIWWPNSLDWTVNLVEKIPLAFFRCEALVVIPLGAWLTWWGAKTMHLSCQPGEDL